MIVSCIVSGDVHGDTARVSISLLLQRFLLLLHTPQAFGFLVAILEIYPVIVGQWLRRIRSLSSCLLLQNTISLLRLCCVILMIAIFLLG